MHIKIVKINSTPQINIKKPVPYLSSEYPGVRPSYKLVDNSDLMYPTAAYNFKMIRLKDFRSYKL
jgi:hypothetical protein